MPLRNRVTEKDLRDHLDAQNYYANSARVHELELVGIERPGWVQVFRCHVEAKHRQDGWQELFGVIRDDERASFEVDLYEQATEQQARIDELTTGMLVRPGSRSGESSGRDLLSVLAMLAALFVVAACGVAASGLL